MSNTYKIKEISRLYGLCTDTLRYYEEQGLLSPKRGDNNYRMFGVQDIGKLNIIRSLRELDIPIGRIREYLESRTIESTLALMDEEEALILKKIEELKAKLKDVNTRRRELMTARSIEDGRCSIGTYPARPCLQLSEDVILENDIDFVLKKLENQYEKNIHAIGIKGFGAVMDPVFVEQGICSHFQSVFFINSWDSYNWVIPEGDYASLYYRGVYERAAGLLPKLRAMAEEKGYRFCGTPMELYHIDMNDTKEHREYLTEIQVQVERIV